MLTKDDVEYTLDWILEWLEDMENEKRIARFIAGILEDVKETRRDWRKR